jgi:hypothetical protein
MTATVPFDFFVGNRLFHSGKYTISSSSSDAFQGTLLIRSADGQTAGFFLAAERSFWSFTSVGDGQRETGAVTGSAACSDYVEVGGRRRRGLVSTASRQGS